MLQAVALQHQPIFIVIADLETDPETGHVVDLAGEFGIAAQFGADIGLQLRHQYVVRHRFDLVGLFQRIDAHALVAGEVEQQFAPHFGRGVRQRGTGNGDN